MTNVTFSVDGDVTYCKLPTGITFLIDTEQIGIVSSMKWYFCPSKPRNKEYGYITNRYGVMLHTLLLECPTGYEIDHIGMDTMDNRRCNLRVCTHQQNQCNQGLQANNTSGVAGVSYYPPRRKFRARIKIGQHDIHLGYYHTFEEAVQARNVGMQCMFGEYGRYNDVPNPPDWIKDKVISQCRRFADLSLSEAFSVTGEIEAA